MGFDAFSYCPPNNALQRTRLRAPLSFETLGALKLLMVAVVIAATGCAAHAQPSSGSPRGLVDAQVTVFGELMKLARKRPAYYSVAVMDGTNYESPSTSLLEALVPLTDVPLKPWIGSLDAQALNTFSNRNAVQIVVMVRPDTETRSFLFLRGAVTEYGRTVGFRFKLEPRQGVWTVTGMVKVGTVESGPL